MRLHGEAQLKKSAKEIFDSRAVDLYQRQVKSLERELAGLTDQQLSLRKAMKGMKEGNVFYDELASKMKKANRETREASSLLSSLESQYKRLTQTQREQAQQEAVQASQSRGAFRQGFVQGAGVGEYMPRGPGFGRQVAGRLAGAATIGRPGQILRGLAGGTTYSGIAGLSMALQGIPGVGGALAGQLQTAQGFSQRAFGLEQQSLGLLAYAGMSGGGRARRARQAALGGAKMPEEAFLDQQAAAAASAAYKKDPREAAAKAFVAKRQSQRGVGSRFGVGDYMAAAPEREEAARVTGLSAPQLQQERLDAASRAVVTKRKEVLDSLNTAQKQSRKKAVTVGGEGTPFLMGPEETMQFRSQLYTSAGSAVNKRARRFGMAMQRRYGLGADVTGAFLKAERRGGILGAEGVEGERAQLDVMAKGLKMGLDGSELITFMQQMAGDLSNINQTGLPIAPGSVSDIGNMLGGQIGMMGGSGRAAVLGQQAVAGMRSIGQQGPQTAAQFQALRMLGGFKEGGSAMDLFKAQSRLEEGNFVEGGMKRYMDFMVQAGGGGGTGAFTLMQSLKEAGVNLTKREVLEYMGEETEGGAGMLASQARERRRGRRKARGVSGSVAGVTGAVVKGLEGLSPELKAHIKNQTDQVAVGKQLFETVNSLEGVMTEAAKGISEFAGPEGALTRVTAGMHSLSKLVPQVTDKMQEMIDKIESR